MNVKIAPSFALALAILTLLGCTKSGFYEYPEEPSKIVVSANAVAGERMVVFINYSLPYYATDTVVKDFRPQVRFKDGDNGSIELVPKGIYPQLSYTTADFIRANASLELSVSALGFESVTTHTKVPQAAVLAPIIIDPSQFTNTMLDSANSLIRAPFTIALADLPATDSLFAFRLNYERTIEENGQELTIESEARFVASGGTLAYLYEMPDGAFLIDKKYWANNLGAQLKLDAVIDYPVANTEEIKLLLEWRTVSPDYYKYHLSLARSGNFTTPLSTLDVIHNNIEGGYGNFSSFARSLTAIKIL